mgnify:FL=1|tara:strand:- start:49 stop:336 length:288 start_codon:yes stop_codon:yes gene_type:complete
MSLPKWFTGEIYERGDTVTNHLSGEKYTLTAEELSMYDFIKGASILLEINSSAPSMIQEGMKNISIRTTNLRRGIDWFKINNNEAYMVLLDNNNN